ncbi:hypothetical protein DY000_02039488 [Brassica cretica]|uniref:Uncharacterized protein n=1 Tax=Brassica cretica TaxID=69181 RepID=A0ABQ7B5L8_BRACR|nr:hypothetical protein DY000_02039488 [Brassica cretica]
MRGDTCCTHVVRHVSHTCKRTPLTSRWLAAWLECMRRDTPPSACPFAFADRRTAGFLEEFHNTEIRVFAQLRVFPSCFDPVMLASRPA